MSGTAPDAAAAAAKQADDDAKAKAEAAAVEEKLRAEAADKARQETAANEAAPYEVTKTGDAVLLTKGTATQALSVESATTLHAALGETLGIKAAPPTPETHGEYVQRVLAASSTVPDLPTSAGMAMGTPRNGSPPPARNIASKPSPAG